MDTVAMLFSEYPQLAYLEEPLRRSNVMLQECFSHGGKLLVCGNGGSAADAMHIVGELMKGFVLPRPVPDAFRAQLQQLYAEDGTYLANNLQGALPTISLVSEMAFRTAFSNDCGDALGFAQQVYGHGQRGDILLALSTSGNSQNVVYAAQTARAIGMCVIALTGRSGGKLRETCDILMNVPEESAHKVQELHVPIYHAICLALEDHFFA